MIDFFVTQNAKIRQFLVTLSLDVRKRCFEEGSYSRLIDFFYHTTLSSRVIMKKKKKIDATRGLLSGISSVHIFSEYPGIT